MEIKSLGDLVQALQPDTDNLIVVGILIYLIYATYHGTDVSQLANTALGGLIGYLGASARSNVTKPTLPPNVVTGIKTEVAK